MTGRLGLGRQEKIKKKQEFKIVFDAGKRYSNNLISIVFNSQPLIAGKSSSRGRRLGVIVSRKVGNAVQRNRLKRYTREIFRIHQQEFKKPIDLVVIMKPAAREATRDIFQTGFLELCKKAHLI